MQQDLAISESRLPVLPMIEVEGRTVREVTNALCTALYGGELEPEWLLVANYSNWGAGKENRHGLKPASLWPTIDQADSRLSIAVDRGNSEGWIVTVSWLQWSVPNDACGHWVWTPLVLAKTLTRTHAWAVCAAMSRMLEVA